MPKSFSEWQATLEHHDLDAMIIRVAQGVDGMSFNELAAARERFTDIAFHVFETSNEQRALAACWVRALESTISLLLRADVHTYQAFLKARNASMERVLEHGYGSVSFLSRVDPSTVIGKVLSAEGQSQERDAERDRRHFLAGVAFGRGQDSEDI